MKRIVLAVAVLAILFAGSARADSGDTTVIFNETILPAGYVYANPAQGFFPAADECMDVAMGVDQQVIFYSTIVVTLPTSVADSSAFGWTPIAWSNENFSADWIAFLNSWSNIPSATIDFASVTESTVPPCPVPEPRTTWMLLAGIAAVVLLAKRRKDRKRESTADWLRQ